MRHTSFSMFLVLSLGLGATAAACGGGAGPGPVTPPTPSASAAPTETAPTPSASTTASIVPSASASAVPTVAPLMKPPIATAMGAELKAIGLDVKNLPSMATMMKAKKKELRQVMPLLAKATGYKCKECHDADDFAKPTAKKAAAMHMWDDWSRGLTFSDGSPLFCDSCHQGQSVLLDRSDKKSLAKWMQTAYVDPLARKDKKDHGCATCHGDEMDMHFLSTWEKK
jgi:hypothetical protein